MLHYALSVTDRSRIWAYKPLSLCFCVQALHPSCPTGKAETRRYDKEGMPTIALASFPRSGNSYTRSLIGEADETEDDWRTDLVIR